MEAAPTPGVNVTAANLETALRLASHGIAVFPCKPDKSPYTPNGHKDAATDELSIQRWWRQHPDALPAISCPASGLIVIDADNRPAVEAKPAKDGRRAVKAKAAINGLEVLSTLALESGIVLTESPCVDTPSGGGHCYYRLPPGMASTDSPGTLPGGLDVRGAGYVIAPGAMRRDGRRYRPVTSSPDLAAAFKAGTIPVLPDAFAAHITAGKHKPVESPLPTKGALQAAPGDPPGTDAPLPPHGEPPALPPPSSAVTAREASYAAEALRRTHADLSSRAAGSGRNAALNTAALALGELAGAGWVGRADVEAALTDACRRNGYEAKDRPAAFQATMRSGIEAGMRNPRRPLADGDLPIREDVAALVAGMQAGAARQASGGGQQQAIAAPAFAALPPSPALIGKPFVVRDVAMLVRPALIYGKEYIGKVVSATVATGGAGKSILHIMEALAIASGRDLAGVIPNGRHNVLYYNGEDDGDVLQNRFQAAMHHHGIDRSEVEGRLFVDSGIDSRWVTAQLVSGQGVVRMPVVQAIVDAVKAKNIKVLIVDPFVTTHGVSENDNGQIAAVVADWIYVAAETGCAVMLVHHITKSGTPDGELTANSARGAGAFGAAVRYMRTMRQMTKAEAEKACISLAEHKQYVEIATVKSNFSTMDVAPHWVRIVAVRLADDLVIAAVERWRWPHTDDVSEFEDEQIRAVHQVISGGDYNVRSNGKNWVGVVLGSIFGLNKLPDKHLAQTAEMKRIVAALIKEGWIKETVKANSNDKQRRMVVVGKMAGTDGLLDFLPQFAGPAISAK